MLKFAVVMAALGINVYVYHFFATAEVTPPRTPLTAFPKQLGAWTCTSDTMTDQVEKNLGVTDYLLCTFQGPSATPVGLYVGYHATQVRKEGGGANENMIHPPAHCLPGSGWDIIAARRVELDVSGLPNGPALVNRLIIAKENHRHLVYYWYQERGRVIAEDWLKIVDLFWDRATNSRSDGALVRFTVPVGPDGEEAAENALLALAGEIVPRLPAYVPN